MAQRLMVVIQTTVTDRHSGDSVTLPPKRLRWSATPRRQCAILVREADRAADRAAGEHGWLADMLATDTTVLRSGPATIV